MGNKFWQVMVILSLIFVPVNYLKADVVIEGNGELEENQQFDYKILNIGDAPEAEAQTVLIFSNTDATGGANPFPTTAVKGQQYIKLVFINNVIDARVVLFTNNKSPDANPKFSGDNTVEDSSYEANIVDEATGLSDGNKPISVTGGMVGESFTDEVTPIVWQVYEYWQGDPLNPYPYDWYVYDYENPTEPDMNRDSQYRNPTDWWGFVVDKYALDWQYAIDFDTGHVGTSDDDPNNDNDDPDNNDLYDRISTVGYRTIIDSFGNLGGFPGARNADGYRIDDEGNPIPVDDNGSPDPSYTQDIRVAPGVLQPNGSIAYEVYIYFGANLFKRSAQGYSTNKLILKFESDSFPEVNQEVEIPAITIYNSGTTLGATIKPRTPNDSSTSLTFTPDDATDTHASCRQYLKIDAQTNIRDSRLVFYTDSTYNGAFPQFTGSRTEQTSFTPTAAELTYVHPYPDSEHDLTEQEELRVDIEEPSFADGYRPGYVTGGLVRKPTTSDPHEWGTDEVAPIVWQVYPKEYLDGDANYPSYIYIDPLDAEATDRWAFTMDKYALDWDWALGEDRHFIVDTTSGDPDNNYWISNKGYRTILDYWGNLGSFPGKRDANGNRVDENGDGVSDAEVIEEYPTPSIYLYLGANYYGKHVGTYKSERIILRLEQ